MTSAIHTPKGNKMKVKEILEKLSESGAKVEVMKVEVSKS